MMNGTVCGSASLIRLQFRNILILSIVPHLIFSARAADVMSRGATPVLVEFYGEALCPDCAAFTTRVLAPLWEEGLDKIMTLRYIGWGNVRNTTTGYECQHGPEVHTLLCDSHMLGNI